jgi:hypothetical protein
MVPDHQAPAYVPACPCAPARQGCRDRENGHVEQIARFELGHRLGVNHAAVGNNAYARYSKAAAQVIDPKDQRRHSAVLAGHISEHTGRPSPLMSTARISGEDREGDLY